MASLLISLKTLYIVLMCIMAVAIAYTLVIDGDSSCFDLSARWTIVAVTDFLVFMVLIVAWYFYKESSWIKRIVFIIMIFWCGSVVTCGYISMLLFKLPPEESLKDALYFVLAKHQNRDVTGHTIRSSVVTAKVIVTAIGCCMLGVTIYAYIIDGFPFFVEVLTPCTITALTDVYIHIVVFSVWIAYKESSWISALFWILLLVCFSSIAICIYIVRELFYLSPGQPISLILFNNSNRLYPYNIPPIN
ncbi:hypothetical protein L1987_52462 [Smallanthus sonchifolius]|uniref:Uncharacterized protein n=1 Tax=Smallanthus sonchifolius TaxID=185202 RepID=A0ACB9ESN2_9ASTR|nr:hypothetical protein L1987_52462 [Smallanthus sonchifolius]